MPPRPGGRDVGQADEAFQQEFQMHVDVIEKDLDKNKRIKDHESNVGSLVTWLGDSGNRSRMTMDQWQELTDYVFYYFSEMEIKKLPCHVALCEKILLHNGQANKQLTSTHRRKFQKWLIDNLGPQDSKNALIPALVLKHEQLLYELLKFPEYRSAFNSKMLVQCAELFLDSLAKEKDGSFRTRAVSILESVFLEMRRDEGHVSKELSARIFDIFQSLDVGLDAGPFFRAVTQCLLTFAPDHYDKAKGLCSSLHHMLKEKWSSTGMDSQNRALVQYLLVFIRGQLATPDQVKECYDLLQSHICNVANRPKDILGSDKSDMPSEWRDLFELFADMLHLRLEKVQVSTNVPHGGSASTQESPAKRMKPLPALEVILGNAFNQATSLPNVNWLQFLCIFTERYPADVPEAFCCSVVEKIKKALTTKLDDTKCVWLCHTLVCIEQLLRCTPSGEPENDISIHWEAIFRHTVEQLKVRRLVRADVVTGVQLRMLTSALCGRQLSASVVDDCLPQIWSLVSYAISGEFLKIPVSSRAAGAKREASTVQRLIEVQKVFAEFVGAVLRRNALADARKQGCSRENLLLLIFDTIKEQCSGPVPPEWFSSVASMIVCTVSSLSCIASAKEMRVETHGVKAESNEQYMWRDLSGAGSDQDMFRLRLNMLEEHMASAGHLAVKSASAGALNEPANCEVGSSVLPQVRSISLQQQAWDHLRPLIESAGEDGMASKFFVPLACEILRAAVKMDAAEQCNDILLSETAAVLLGDHMADSTYELSLHQILRESDAGSQDSMDLLGSYLDAVFGYRDAVPGKFKGDDSVVSVVKSVCKVCVMVLRESEVHAEQLDDEFDERGPGASAGRTLDAGTQRRMSALELLLKLGHEEPACFTDSEARAIKDFVGSESRAWVDVSLSLNLVFRYPVPLMTDFFLDLMDDITKGKYLMEDLRRNTVVPLAIGLMAHSLSQHNVSGEHAREFLNLVRAKIADYAKTLGEYQSQPPDKKKPLVLRQVRRTIVVCLGHLIAVSDGKFLTLVAERQEQGEFLQAILKCLQDSAWDVRQAIAGVCPSFFTPANAWKVYQPIIDGIQADADAANTPISLVRTHIRTLGNIVRLPEGIVDEAVESSALHMLCVLYKRFPTQEDMIVNVISWAAEARDFSGRMELFSAHMPSILRQWIQARHSWKKFPFSVVGYDTRVDFIRGVAAKVLVPEFEIRGLKHELEDMGKVLDPAAFSRNRDYLFIDNAVAVLERTFHLMNAHNMEDFKSGKVKTSKTLDSHLSEAVKYHHDLLQTDHKNLATRMLSSLDQVLISMLDKTVSGLSLEDGNEFAAAYTDTSLGRDVLKACLETYADWVNATLQPGEKASPGGFLLGVGKNNGIEDYRECTDRLQLVTLHFMDKLTKARRLKQKERVVTAIEVVLDILGDSIFCEERAWAMQHIVWLLLVAMSDESILLKAAQVLDQRIVQVVLRTRTAQARADCYRALAPVLLDIVCSLYPYSINPRFHKLYREIVKNLIVNAPAFLDKTVIKHLPPFPVNDQFFQKVQERFERTRNEEDANGRTASVNWTVEDDIQLFLEGSDHVHEEVQKVRLQHFAAQLQAKESRMTLIEMHKREAASEHGEELTLCVRKLLGIVNQASGSSDIPNLVAQCLGHLGPVVSRSLSVSVLRPRHLPTLKCEAVSKKPRALVIEYHHIHVAILQTLRMYLADRSFEVVSAASELLKNMFREVWVRDLLVDSKDKGAPGRIADGSALDRKTNLWTHPYEYAKPAAASSKPRSDAQSDAAANNPGLWLPGETPYSAWIARLAYRLCLDDNSSALWNHCAEMCLVKPEFAELIFPHLLFGIYTSEDQKTYKVFSAHLNALLSNKNNCVQSVKLALNVLDFFRSFHQDVIQDDAGISGGPSPQLYTEVKKWKTRYWFDIPYNVTARASLRCDAPLTAILYMELYNTEGIRKGFKRRSTTFDVDTERKENELLILNAYRQVDEPDGLLAFNKQNDFHSHIITFEQEEEWGKSLGLFDTILSAKSGTSTAHGLSAVTAMHLAGYNHLPLLASRNLPTIGEEAKCEALWRSGALDLADADSEWHAKDGEKGFNAHLLNALRALEKMVQQKGELDEVKISVEGARLVALKEIAEHELQSIKKSHPVLVRLQSCQDVTDVATVLSKQSGRQDRISDLVEQWAKRYKAMQNRFLLQEPSIALHGVLLGIVKSSCVQKHLCLTAKYALKHGSIPYARCAMLKLQHRLSEAGRIRLPDEWWLTEAKVLWEDRRKDQAMRILCDLEEFLNEGDKSEKDRKLLAKVLKVNAEWLSVSRTERWAEIKQKMEWGLNLRKDTQMSCTNAFFKLAAFLDGMYCQDEEDRDAVKRKEVFITSRIQEMELAYKPLERAKNLTGDAKNDKKNLHYQLLRHREELKSLQEHEEHRQAFMLGAMDNYFAHLQIRGTQKRAVFRILQIWFENSTVDKVNKRLCERLDQMKSLTHNFAILVPQIVSRLDSDSKSNPEFQRALRCFLSRLLEARPDDTLLPLFAAKNETRCRQSSTEGVAGVSYKVNQDRIDAATQLLGSMVTQGLDLTTPDGRAERERREVVLRQTEALVDAYIELADFDIGVATSGPVKAKMQRIKWREEVSLVPVPTSQMGSKVAGFDNEWRFPGGITKPKLITCNGTDGTKHKQIVKGGDDQRCDAVTSQLFQVMGMLLRQDAACCRRQLNVRIYKVIPLHPLAGVLEFVDAISLRSILGDSGKQKGRKTLRDRFREGSTWEKYTNSAIIQMISQWDHKNNMKKRLEAFRDVMKNTEPVFHHYFLEQSWSAPAWFQRRLAYTRSVASISMAGFIVGLGDRHTSNTLLIEASSELLNIDLGIVFDQGRLLATPELVPFRLTREVVDGFGVAGTEGVFTRCCEETLRVLRDNKEDLLAIVDVLLHDPLMSWKMSTAKKAAENRRDRVGQGVESEMNSSIMGSVLEEEEKTADAKMVRKQVKDKLEGRHKSEHLGVEGQVKQLILDARSEEHLAAIYHGWSPWL